MSSFSPLKIVFKHLRVWVTLTLWMFKCRIDAGLARVFVYKRLPPINISSEFELQWTFGIFRKIWSITDSKNAEALDIPNAYLVNENKIQLIQAIDDMFWFNLLRRRFYTPRNMLSQSDCQAFYYFYFFWKLSFNFTHQIYRLAWTYRIAIVYYPKLVWPWPLLTLVDS